MHLRGGAGDQQLSNLSARPKRYLPEWLKEAPKRAKFKVDQYRYHLQRLRNLPAGRRERPAHCQTPLPSFWTQALEQFRSDRKTFRDWTAWQSERNDLPTDGDDSNNLVNSQHQGLLSDGNETTLNAQDPDLVLPLESEVCLRGGTGKIWASAFFSRTKQRLFQWSIELKLGARFRRMQDRFHIRSRPLSDSQIPRLGETSPSEEQPQLDEPSQREKPFPGGSMQQGAGTSQIVPVQEDPSASAPGDAEPHIKNIIAAGSDDEVGQPTNSGPASSLAQESRPLPQYFDDLRERIMADADQLLTESHITGPSARSGPFQPLALATPRSVSSDSEESSLLSLTPSPPITI